MEAAVGFAPTMIITVLQTVPITTLARDYMALPPGFEPGPMASETTTLPLRYGSLLAPIKLMTHKWHRMYVPPALSHGLEPCPSLSRIKIHPVY